MDILERIRQRAASRPQHIVLPEGNDPRTVAAAADATARRIARITLLDDDEKIRSTASDNRLDLGDVAIINHQLQLTCANPTQPEGGRLSGCEIKTLKKVK